MVTLNWEEWEKKFGPRPGSTAVSPEPAPAPPGPTPAPLPQVTFGDSPFSITPTQPTGPSAPDPWAEWEKKFGSRPGTPEGEYKPPTGAGQPVAPTSSDGLTFKDFVGFNPVIGKTLWKGTKEAFNVLADIDTGFSEAAEYTALDRPSGSLGLLYAQERGLVTQEEAQQVRDLRDEQIIGQLLDGA